MKFPNKALAIAGSSGTGKGATSALLSAELGFPIISAGNIMRAEADRLGISLSDLKKKTHGDQFLDYWLDTTTRLAVFEKEGSVVEGRLVAFTVPSAVFRVLLVVENEDGTTDHDTRLSRIAARDKLTLEEARKTTMFREGVMDERYASFYGLHDQEWFQKKYYHLIVNTKTSLPDGVAKQVLDAYAAHQQGKLPEPEHKSLPMF